MFSFVAKEDCFISMFSFKKEKRKKKNTNARLQWDVKLSLKATGVRGSESETVLYALSKIYIYRADIASGEPRVFKLLM